MLILFGNSKNISSKNMEVSKEETNKSEEGGLEKRSQTSKSLREILLLMVLVAAIVSGLYEKFRIPNLEEEIKQLEIKMAKSEGQVKSSDDYLKLLNDFNVIEMQNNILISKYKEKSEDSQKINEQLKVFKEINLSSFNNNLTSLNSDKDQFQKAMNCVNQGLSCLPGTMKTSLIHKDSDSSAINFEREHIKTQLNEINQQITILLKSQYN